MREVPKAKKPRCFTFSIKGLIVLGVSILISIILTVLNSSFKVVFPAPLPIIFMAIIIALIFISLILFILSTIFYFKEKEFRQHRLSKIGLGIAISFIIMIIIVASIYLLIVAYIDMPRSLVEPPKNQYL